MLGLEEKVVCLLGDLPLHNRTLYKLIIGADQVLRRRNVYAHIILFIEREFNFLHVIRDFEWFFLARFHWGFGFKKCTAVVSILEKSALFAWFSDLRACASLLEHKNIGKRRICQTNFIIFIIWPFFKPFVELTVSCSHGMLGLLVKIWLQCEEICLVWSEWQIRYFRTAVLWYLTLSKVSLWPKLHLIIHINIQPIILPKLLHLLRNLFPFFFSSFWLIFLLKLVN